MEYCFFNHFIIENCVNVTNNENTRYGFYYLRFEPGVIGRGGFSGTHFYGIQRRFHIIYLNLF